MRVFSNYSIPAFSIIRESIPFTIHAQHKKIAAIMVIAIALIAACYLAMRFLKWETRTDVEVEDIALSKVNSIDWDSVIEILPRFQMQFDIFKRLLSHSSIESCPYKKIYIAFLSTSKHNAVFDEDSSHYPGLKLPCLPSEALLIYIPQDAEKSKQIENLFSAQENPFNMDYKMISYKEYEQSQRQGYFSSKIIERLFNTEV